MRLLLVAPFHPRPGVAHAGGQYLLRYLHLLAEAGVTVTVVAPEPVDGPSFDVAREGGYAGHAVRRLRTSSRFGRCATAVRHVWDAIDPGSGVLAGFAEDATFHALLDAADLVQLHYTEMLPLGKLVRARRPEVPIFATEYDVFTQSVRRGVRSPTPRVFVKSAVRALHVAHREAHLLNELDRVYVFNPQNLALLRRMGVRTPARATDLFLPHREQADTGGYGVIFVAAFNRTENAEGAEWLLAEVWPRVREAAPGACLTFVGAGSEALPSLSRHQQVEATGQVASLSPHYLTAAVAVAPVRRGAGVKFKVLEAMSYGLPVVTTSVGGEGILGRGKTPPPLIVADSAGDFAESLIALLNDPPRRLAVGRAGRTWVRQEYDDRAVVEVLVEDMHVALADRGC